MQTPSADEQVLRRDDRHVEPPRDLGVLPPGAVGGTVGEQRDRGVAAPVRRGGAKGAGEHLEGGGGVEPPGFTGTGEVAVDGGADGSHVGDPGRRPDVVLQHL
jgi:hypothetical protein